MRRGCSAPAWSRLWAAADSAYSPHFANDSTRMVKNKPSLKGLIVRASTWTIAGHGGAQLIRLASNLVLTRLLFPEAFGIMALVWMVMFGLEMLSDVGLRAAIIRDKRGDEPAFLNTAWTMQAVRGVVLWSIACIIAYPLAKIYGEPQLVSLIPVAGLTALIGGVASTSLHTSFRRMELGRLTVLEVCNQLVAFIAVVTWALLYPSVWALVGGALIACLFHTVASHLWLPGIRHQFRWEASAMRSLVDFGKWIFMSSTLTFLASQGDRMLLGHYISMAQLGVYSIAIMLSEAAHALIIKLVHGVLYPAYGRIAQSEAHRLRNVFHRARLGIDGFLVFPIAVLMVLGGWIIDFLYDPRYHEAGWMFQILCIRLLMSATLANSETCLFALGHPQYAFIQSVCRTVWILIGIPVGWHLMGIEGVVWAVALSEIPVVVILWVGLARNRMFSLVSEARSLIFVGLGILVGFWILHSLP